MALELWPTYSGTAPPRGPADALTWKETRPGDDEYWTRVADVEWRGGWWAEARVAKMYSEPGWSPLIAVVFDVWPDLYLPGALAGTDFDGVPAHYSIAFWDDIPRKLYRRLLRKWKWPRWIWVSVNRINAKGTAEVGSTCAIGRCGLIKRSSRLGATLVGHRTSRCERLKKVPPPLAPINWSEWGHFFPRVYHM